MEYANCSAVGYYEYPGASKQVELVHADDCRLNDGPKSCGLEEPTHVLESLDDTWRGEDDYG